MKAIEINGEIKLFSKYPKNFEHNDRLYINITDSKASEIGFKEVVTPAYDARIEELSPIKLDGDIYTYDVLDKTFSQTLAKLKSDKIGQLKSMVGSQLSQTDWYIIRNADTGAEIPQSIKDDRAALRTASDLIEAEINGLTTKKAVVLFDINI